MLYEFHSLHDEDLSIDEICCRLKSLAYTLNEASHPVTDQDFIINTMCDLISKFTMTSVFRAP
jgi:hypothetical protein